VVIVDDSKRRAVSFLEGGLERSVMIGWGSYLGGLKARRIGADLIIHAVSEPDSTAVYVVGA
jgi:hypothetical protein